MQIQDISPLEDVGVNMIVNNGDNDPKSMLSQPSTASAISSTSNTTIVTTNIKKVSEIEQKIRNARIASTWTPPAPKQWRSWLPKIIHIPWR